MWGFLQDSWKMTRNQDLNVLHVNSASEFTNTVDARVVKGDTLIFDFVYFLHPVRWSRTSASTSIQRIY